MSRAGFSRTAVDLIVDFLAAAYLSAKSPDIWSNLGSPLQCLQKEMSI